MAGSAPIPFIVNTSNKEGELGQLQLNADAATLLQSIGPVAVVTIIGKYRTGKSYLLNRLHGSNGGFSLGDTVQAKTKGIWLWPMPHPDNKDLTLLLLDTEGLYDVEEGDQTHDIKLFCLAVLLSSTMMLNTVGTLDDTHIQQLHLVTELTEHIKTGRAEAEEDGLKFNLYFPKLIFVLRDFFLKLELDGQPCTSDQYMENALKMKKGKGPKIANYNGPRDCIRTFFPERKCFVLPKPIDDDNLLGRLDEVDEARLKPEFVDRAGVLVEHVYSTDCRPLTVDGNVITGARFVQLANTYIDSINSGRCPCIGSAMAMLVQAECTKAMDNAVACFTDKMGQCLRALPVAMTLFQDVRTEAHEAALCLFRQSALKDTDGIYLKKLMDEVGKVAQKFKDDNDAKSKEKCDGVLQNAFQPISVKIKDGVYAKLKNGYAQYKHDKQQAIATYNSIPDKGPQADKVLDEFLEICVPQEHAILQADKALNEKQKALERETEARKREAEHAQMMKSENEIMQKEMVAQQNTYKTTVTAMQQQFEQHNQDLDEEYKRNLEAKEKEYKRLQEEGLAQQAEMTNELIQQMKEEKQQSEEAFKEQLQMVEEMRKGQEEMVKQMSEDRKEDRKLISDLQDKIAQAQAAKEKDDSNSKMLGGLFGVIGKAVSAFGDYHSSKNLYSAISGKTTPSVPSKGTAV